MSVQMVVREYLNDSSTDEVTPNIDAQSRPEKKGVTEFE